MQARVIVTVDVALFTVVDGALRLMLQQRSRSPFQGRPALIGGYIHPERDGDATAAARRILADKTGLDDIFLEQLMTFSGAERDPRGWSVSIAYLALVPHGKLAPVGGADGVTLAVVGKLPPLPFDHDRIAAAAVQRLRSKGAYSSLPAFLLEPEFTMPQLKDAYQTVMGEPLNDSAFRRKMADLGIIEEVADAKSPATALRRRPAQLYRLKQRALVAFDRTL